MTVGSKMVKVPVCFLCLRNVVVGETPGLNGSNNGDADRDLLRRFLSLSLKLPPAVVWDLLCSSNGQVATGADHDDHDQGKGHGKNLLCESCAKEVSATCKLYRDLARKLKNLEGILEKSNETVSEKLRVNLHQKVAKQLNGNCGGDRVKRLRNVLASKLRKRGRKLAGEDEDESESQTLKKSQPMSKSNLNQDNAEVTENSAFENEENVSLNEVKAKMDDDPDADSDDGQSMVMGTRTKVKDSAPVVTGWSDSSGQSSDDDDEVKKRPFQCLRCNDLFENIKAVEDHVDLCRDGPIKVERKTKAIRKPVKAQKKRSAKNSKVGKALKHVKLGGGDGSQQKLCRFCGKTFSSLVHLNDHERIHTGEKPFACRKCKRRFNKKWNCKQHESICHGKAEAKISNGNGDNNGNGIGIFQPISGKVEEIDVDGMDADAEEEEEENPAA